MSNIILQKIPEDTSDSHDMLKHGDPNTKKWKEARRMASTHIIRLFANHKTHISTEMINKLKELTQNILLNRTDILIEFCNIVEGLLCTADVDYAAGVLNHAKAIFYQEPKINYETINSLEFLKNIGMDINNPHNLCETMISERARAIRTKVNTSTNLFQAVFRRCNEEVLSTVLTNKMDRDCFLIPFTVMKATSGLWSDKVLKTLESVNCLAITEISEAERKVLLGGEQGQESTPSTPLELSVRRLQAFISHNSDQAIITIANMLNAAPDLIQEFQPYINDCLFNYLDGFNLFRYRRIVKHFFVSVLPKTKSADLVIQSLNYMGNRLRLEWSRNLDDLNLSEDDEIIRDKHMTFLTREFISVLKECCFDLKLQEIKSKNKPHKKPVPGSPKEWRLNEKGKLYLFTQEVNQKQITELGGNIFETVLHLLPCHDSLSANQAAQLLWALCTEFFSLDRNTQINLCGNVLTCIINAMKFHPANSDVAASLNSLSIEFFFICTFIFPHNRENAKQVLKDIPNSRDATIYKFTEVISNRATAIKWRMDYNAAGICGAVNILDKTIRGIFTVLCTGLKMSKEEQEQKRRIKAGYDMPPLFQDKVLTNPTDQSLGKEGLIKLFAEED